MLMSRLLRYLACLANGRLILWCYAIWYGVTAVAHFDPNPRLWLTSIGLSGIIGTALIISTQPASGKRAALDSWVVFRLYLMPFCVSSFAALVKSEGYILVFSPSRTTNLVGVALIILFLTLVRVVKKLNYATRGVP